MNDLTKNILVFVVIIVVLLSVVQGLSGVSGGQPQAQDYSEFLRKVRSGQVDIVEFDGQKIRFGDRKPLQFYTISPETDNNTLIGILDDNHVHFSAAEPKSQSLIGQLLISSFPILLLLGRMGGQRSHVDDLLLAHLAPAGIDRGVVSVGRKSVQDIARADLV